MYGPDTNFYSKGITSPARIRTMAPEICLFRLQGPKPLPENLPHQARPHHPPIARQILKLLPGVSQFLVVLYRRLLQRKGANLAL